METSPLDTGILILVLALLGLGCIVPTLGDGVLRPIERVGALLAKRKWLSICLVAAAPAIIRLSLLWWLPVPTPSVHDEFSYLLAGDTFAHGHLTNPPHPMSVYFDTFHVNQHPTYMSKYPPAQGAFLAIGQLLGCPWIGVVLSVSLMCGALVWMLQGWLPSRWALLGGVLVVMRVGISTYWINSYWGGAVAAMGGALLVGALPRIMRFRRSQDAAMLGIGAAILANSRPFEGLIFSLPLLVALAVWFCGRRRPTWRGTALRIILPAFGVLGLTLVFMGYYNWRGTGQVLLFPYVVNNRTYMTAPEFVWDKEKQPRQYLNPQFDAFYSDQAHQIASAGKIDGIARAENVFRYDAEKFGRFFLWPELCVPFLALPWMLMDRRVRFLLFQFIFCFLGFFLAVFFLEHYAAPLTATSFALVVQGLRHMRRWSFYGRPIGVGLSRAIISCSLLLAAFQTYSSRTDLLAGDRSRLAKELNAIPGDHLVVVRYSSDHDPNDEWVYNRADIDHAKIVWAREIPGISMQPLLDYFRGRQVWLLEPDISDPELAPYKPTSPD